MNELVKTLVTSSVLAGLVSGGVSWVTTSYKIKQELHSKQSEAGYAALVEANTLLWQSTELMEEAKRKEDTALAAKALELRRKSDASYSIAQHKIAAFGDERVVKAMSDYYYKHGTAATSCSNKEKFRSDTQIYMAIRNTLGVGGSVNDEHLANLVFRCSLK